MSDQSLVMFRDNQTNLQAARAALTATPLTVAGDDQELQVSWQGGPLLRITFERGPDVLAEARELGFGTEFADALQDCDARFVIALDDLDAVLDEANTLIEAQLALQHATEGVLFNSWNEQLSGPEAAR